MAITEEYKAYLKSPEWKEKRLEVLRRDKFICQKCKKEWATEVHHLTYKNIYNERLEDLLSVCKGCHEKIHNIKTKRTVFGNVLARVFR